MAVLERIPHLDVTPDDITFTRWDEMEAELSILLGREVDFVFKESIAQSQNWMRRRHILDSAQVIYDAGCEIASLTGMMLCGTI